MIDEATRRARKNGPWMFRGHLGARNMGDRWTVLNPSLERMKGYLWDNIHKEWCCGFSCDDLDSARMRPLAKPMLLADELTPDTIGKRWWPTDSTVAYIKSEFRRIAGDTRL